MKLSVVISGLVQGVGFRQFVKNRAEQLGIVGRVWNTNDGNVEVYAYGDEKLLEEFVSLIKIGPVFSQVVSIDIVSSDENADIIDFKIIKLK